MRYVARLLATVAVTIALVLTASPAHASGGGCLDKWQGGFAVGVCSADDGVYMYPDLYINSAPSYSGYCEVRSWIDRDNVHVPIRFVEYGDCTVGHWVADRYLIQGYPCSWAFTHYVEIWLNNVRV